MKMTIFAGGTREARAEAIKKRIARQKWTNIAEPKRQLFSRDAAIEITRDTQAVLLPGMATAEEAINFYLTSKAQRMPEHVHFLLSCDEPVPRQLLFNSYGIEVVPMGEKAMNGRPSSRDADMEKVMAESFVGVREEYERIIKGKGTPADKAKLDEVANNMFEKVTGIKGLGKIHSFADTIAGTAKEKPSWKEHETYSVAIKTLKHAATCEDEKKHLDDVITSLRNYRATL